MRKFTIISTLILLITGFIAQAGAVVLISEGQAAASIVIDPTAHAAEAQVKSELVQGEALTPADEKTAAVELVRVLEKMTGVRLLIGTEPVEGLTPIYLGRCGDKVIPDLDEKLKHPDPLALVNDRLLIDVSDQRVVLAGSYGWATRLAVTHALKEMGCRWYGAGEFFEVIPERSSVELKTQSTLVTPDFERRDIWYIPDHDRAHLMIQRHHGVFNYGHSWHDWVGKERKERPELRGLVHGERTGKLEFTHPEVPDIFAKNIIAYLEKSAQRTVSLSTDDGQVISESKEAAQWLITEWSNPFMSLPSISDAMMRLFNKVIPKVLEEKPDTVFGFLIYSNTVAPPRYEKVHPQLAVVGAPLGENPLVPTDSDDPRRSVFREHFEVWMQLAHRGYIYEYDPLVVWNSVLSPRVELIRRNIPYYKSIGVRGMEIESRPGQFSESGLNILVYTHLFWDTAADVDAILDEYCETFYGPAAKPIREWIRVTQEAMLNHDSPDNLFGNEEQNIELILTRKTMAEAGRHLESAEQQANDEPWKTRVQVVRLIHDKVTSYLAAKDHIDRCNFAEALEAWDRIATLNKQLHAIEPSLNKYDAWHLTVKAPPWFNGVREQIADWAALTGQAKADERAAGELLVTLPERWAFAFDPNNLGLTNDWQKRETLPQQTEINIGQPWDNQGFVEPRLANGWYRTTFTLDNTAAGKPVHLYFTRMYGMKFDLFIDGELVEHRDGPRYFWYDYHHEQDFDITDHVKPGVEHTVTLRIFKEFDWGGPYGGVFIYSPKTKESSSVTEISNNE